MKIELNKSYKIDAPVSKVWDALTNPKIIKEYFFGTEAISDWKKGSAIIYKGTWDGKEYEDKGKIIDLIPEKYLQLSFWSSLSGKPNQPENYILHSYQLEPKDVGTELILTQEGDFDQEEKRKIAWKNWDIVIDGMKKIVER